MVGIFLKPSTILCKSLGKRLRPILLPFELKGARKHLVLHFSKKKKPPPKVSEGFVGITCNSCSAQASATHMSPPAWLIHGTRAQALCCLSSIISHPCFTSVSMLRAGGKQWQAVPAVFLQQLLLIFKNSIDTNDQSVPESPPPRNPAEIHGVSSCITGSHGFTAEQKPCF